jgi:hypothetical protein
VVGMAGDVDADRLQLQRCFSRGSSWNLLWGVYCHGCFGEYIVMG